MDYNTYIDGLQVEVSPDGEVFELLDRRFPWDEKKVKTMRLHELYRKAGYPDYADRVRDCGTFLQFGVHADGERRLQAANFCQQRLCPMCIGRRARRYACKLTKVLDLVEREHHVKFIFLTLTIRNVMDGSELGDSLAELTRAWNRLLQHRQMKRAIKGWYRAVEITRKKKGYHPHIHAILAVDADYFGDAKKYLEHDYLVAHWRKALRVDYDPSVDVRVAKARRKGGGVEQATLAAAKEAGKYPIKDVEYIDPTLPEHRAVEIVRDYTRALYKRRLTAFGGCMKAAARELDAEDMENGDLIHADDGDIRTDIAEMVEIYHWHFGAGQYLLARREINPLRE